MCDGGGSSDDGAVSNIGLRRGVFDGTAVGWVRCVLHDAVLLCLKKSDSDEDTQDRLFVCGHSRSTAEPTAIVGGRKGHH